MTEEQDLTKYFYKNNNFTGLSVFDPFMGSGVTVGEAYKLGCTVLGRDINPVACESVRNVIGLINQDSLEKSFSCLTSTVAQRIQALYTAEDNNGNSCSVLYYFWVKYIPCSHCKFDIDLFSSRVFARNAYPDRKPEVQICCPKCGNIFCGLNTDKIVYCPNCQHEFNPHFGNVSRTQVSCPHCLGSFSLAKAVQALEKPLPHRLYAKLLLTPDNQKLYCAATSKDVEAYKQCSETLKSELERRAIRLPDTQLMDGHNTRQVINYNYRNWRDFFNDRQLLALGWLQEAIAQLTDTQTRDVIFTLFSGALEFNNIFASYKGEGTGAVRHMFSHHVLKPERTPIEANVWGTAKSSGGFANLFKTRILRALDYWQQPFEVTAQGSGKIYLESALKSVKSNNLLSPKTSFETSRIYLSCGSSDKTKLSDKSANYIVTDPPFFDNVHYSELADFFLAWQRLYPRGFIQDIKTTRHPSEVQDISPNNFSLKLQAVFTECHRVLKDEGLLVFTYHHSRTEGWTALVQAIWGSGFSVVNVHPVKAEMSGATPKSQAKEPIQIDIIFVCQKRTEEIRPVPKMSELLNQVLKRARQKQKRLVSIGLKLSLNDCRIILLGQFIAGLGSIKCIQAVISALIDHQDKLEEQAIAMYISASEGKS